jgi:hypothetical protein
VYVISVFCAGVVGEEVEPAPSGELDLCGIDDNEIDKVRSHLLLIVSLYNVLGVLLLTVASVRGRS